MLTERINMVSYSTEDKEEMKNAFQALAKSKRSRLLELIEFMKVSGYKKIGIANCLSMQQYANKLVEILQNEGFEVFSINCKQSGLDGSEISPDMKGASCDPISQADYLNEMGTEFNINVGLCLGHGLLFDKYSKAPVTTFVVKDFAHNHNVLESLNE